MFLWFGYAELFEVLFMFFNWPEGHFHTKSCKTELLTLKVAPVTYLGYWVMNYDVILEVLFWMFFICNIAFVAFYSIQGYLLYKNWKGERKPIVLRMVWGVPVMAVMSVGFFLACGIVIGTREGDLVNFF